MKCKINIFSTLFAMIIAPLFFQSNANAQSDCSNAFAFSMDSVSQTYSINDSVLWMEFEADTNFVLFEVTTHDTNYVVEHITLYSGTCGSLQQLATSTSSSLSSANLVKNNLYKLKISLNGIYNGGIDIYNILLSCPTKAFIYANPKTICAGDSVYFENRSSGNNSNGYVFTWTFDGQAPNFSALINPNNCNPGTQNIQDFFITFNNPGVYIVYLYEWGHTLNYLWSIDSVIITVLDSSSFIPVYKKSYTCNENVCFSDISHNIKPLQNTGIGYINGISWTFYEINLNYFQTFYTNSGDTICIGKFQNGTYILQAYASGYCEDFDLLDTIEIVRDEPKPVIPSIACVGESVMMVDTSHCPLFWKWTFGDGSVGIGNDTIYHIYNQPGVYIVELQTDSGGTIVYKSIEIKKATKPLISGSFTTCDSTVLYTIENYDTNYIYTWSTQLYDPSTNQYSSGSFVINGSGTVVSADSALIDWYSSGFPYLPEYALVTVEAKLKGTNCSDISTFEVYQCCEGEPGSGYTLIYDSIFQGTTIINGGNFVVNGLITVTDTMIINSSALWMGPYAKIELDSGAYFKLDNSLIQAGCFFMWDGIYSDNQTESVILNNSTFYDAINGAISKNGAKLYSDSMRFINNYISLQVLDHKQNFFSFPPQSFTPADIRIRATNFNGKDGLYSVPNMLAPYQNDQPYTGIKIRNMQNIAVGDISTGSNFYKEMKNGIVIYNSSVSVVNNHFKLIESLYYSPNYDAAAITINAPAMNDMDNIGDVTIGNLNSYQNTFDSCYQSVYSNNSKVKIMKNIFKYGHQSVRIDNFKNGSLVSYNRFKDAEFGVRVQSLLGGPKQLDIALNYFEGQNDNTYSSISREAINVINCNSQPNSTIRTKVNNNTVYWAGPRNYTTGAIRVQNSNGILVSSNHLVRQTAGIAPINNDWQNVIGIRVASSQGAQIVDNYVFGFGQSITTYGNLTGTQFSCNELKMYKYGFYWSAFTSLSDQGIFNVRNTHNEWASAVVNNEKLAQGNSAGNIMNNDTIQWYYNSNFGSNWIPDSVFYGSLLKIAPFINNNGTHLCAGGSGSGTPGGGGTGTGGGNSMNSVLYLYDNLEDPELRDWLFEDILQGQEYVDLQNEYRAYDAEFLYNMLKEDTTMMFLGGDRDADYQAFFDSIKETELGKFEQVYRLIQDGSFEEAQIMNESLVPGLDIFVNLKTVLAIYLDSWCKERYELTTTEYQTLYEIADQTPYAAGDAVYTARIMIGYEPDEHEVAYRVHKPNSTSGNEQVKLYPNPASESVTIEFENVDFKQVNAELNVYSITGKFIESYHFQTSNSYKVLSTERLQNGIYLYHIRLDNGISKSGKLVILKQ